MTIDFVGPAFRFFFLPLSVSIQNTKAAPAGSLTSLLARYMAAVYVYSGGLTAMALLWSEFVMELRCVGGKLRVSAWSCAQSSSGFFFFARIPKRSGGTGNTCRFCRDKILRLSQI